MPAKNKPPLIISRRRLFTGGAAVAAGAAFGVPLLAGCGTEETPSSGGGSGTTAAANAATSKVDYQIAWVGDNGALGDVVAFQKGWYTEAGLDLAFRPGGPSIDPITASASGAVTFSQTSSSPAVMLGRSQGVPVKAFATGLQSWPWAMISTAENPVRKPEDLVGKTVGTQSTGQILVQAVLEKNNIDPSTVDVQVVGSDVTPLLAGRIDVFTGWTTNLQSYAPLGDDYLTLTIGESGIKSYANVYITTDDVIEQRADDLEAFVAATAKGWDYARQNPDEAVDLLLKQFSGLDKDAQVASGKKLMTYMFTDETAKDGWGTMSTDSWQSQLDLWEQMKQFKAAAPKVEDVMTLDILEATADQRPKVNSA